MSRCKCPVSGFVLFAAFGLAGACSDALPPEPTPPPPPPPCASTNCVPPPLGTYTSLAIATYDGSGQVVHPDVITDPRTPHALWMVLTPYPGGNAAFENPSMFASTDGVAWTPPTGLANPVVHPTTSDYLSDPDLVFDPSSQQLWMFYRTVTGGENRIGVVRSNDGTHWNAPEVVLSAASHEIVSPSVVRNAPGAPWQMWSINAGRSGCVAAATTVELRTSANGTDWGAAQQVVLRQPGQNIWHIDVEWIPERAEYWALYNTYPAGSSCVTDAIYLARSADGVHWTTYPSPVMRRGAIAPFSDIVYRSTFRYDPLQATATFWLSGATLAPEHGYIWSAATVTWDVQELLGGLAVPPRANARSSAARGSLPPPEPDVGGGVL